MRIPLINLRPGIEETRPVWQGRIEQLLSRMQFVLGEQVDAFEREFACHLGARFSIGVASGTDAIELCVRDSRIRGEVITSALTSPFSVIALKRAGLTVRFADVHPDSLQINASDVAQRVTERTAGVLAVHLYGQACDVDTLSAVCRDHGLVFFQDACQAHGYRWNATAPLSEMGEYVAYSFYPTKNLGCLGDGGAVVTNSSRVNRRIRMLRDGGRRFSGQVSFLVGANSRLDEMQACYLRSFLPCLQAWNDRRRRLAALYDAALQDCGGVRLLHRDPWSVCHLYVIRAERRNRLRAHLARLGIGTGVHYPVPLHLHPAFRDCTQKKGSLPAAEEACKEIVSLPIWPHLPESDALCVAENIRAFYR